METISISKLPSGAHLRTTGDIAWPALHMNLPGRFFLALLLFCILLAHHYARSRRRAKSVGCHPAYRQAPIKDPFIGIDFVYEKFFRKTPAPTLKESFNTYKQLGKTYSVSRWTCETVNTCDAENIKHILATAFEDYELPKVRISVMTGLLGTGIFTLNGRSWSHARAILRPTMTKQKMGALPSMLERHFNAFSQRLPSGTGSIDLQPLFFGLSMDIATDFLMGHSTNMLNKDNADEEQQFVDDYMLCSEEATDKMRLGPISWLRYNRRAETAKLRVFDYIDKYIDVSRLRQPSAELEGREKSFMHDLEAAIEDRKTLRDQVLHILLASRDTTASLLSNLFFTLAKEPEIYSKLREEIMATIGQGIPIFDELKDIRFLKWCVNESLRLHPVIPTNARQATRDTSLPKGGGPDGQSPLFVSKGTIVMYNVYAMHRDSQVFGHDVDEFIPERWEGLRPGWGYLPFNGGPRICLGQQFALLETYYIVTRLVQRFERIESMDSSEWMELSALATTCKNGVHVQLHGT